MKFVVEALGLRAAGGKELALNLLSRLPKYRSHEFVVLLPNLREYSLLSAMNVKRIQYSGSESLLARYLFLNRTVTKVCVEQDADALLCLGNFAPRKPPCATAVLLQNAYVLYRDGASEGRLTFREKLTVAYGRDSFRRLAPAVHTVVQTEVMKRRLVSCYEVDPQRVSVIPNACSLPEVRPDDSIRRRTRPVRPFTFVCVARYYAHKNLEILLDAVRRVALYISRPFKCVITISPDQHPGARRLLKRIRAKDLSHVLNNIGPVPYARLPETYLSADALILPTLLESFTRTYHEAMHFGLPILTSDRDFAQYCCQDAAIYFDPLDANSVARAMARIMEDEGLRLRLAENGKRILKQMPTWDQIAAQFVAVLEKAAVGDQVHSANHAEAAAPGD